MNKNNDNSKKVTRIRYFRENNVMYSGPLFNGKTDLIVTIFPDTKTYQITDGLEIVKQGGGTSPHAIKKEVKIELSSLGVNFDDEVRAKKGSKKHIELGTETE